MYTKIRNRLRRQHLLNNSMFFAQYVGVALALGILLCHRLLMVYGIWLWVVWVLVPVFAAVQLQKNPILKRHVLRYAERQSGESGFLWFDEEAGVDAESWSKDVAERWSMVEPPSLQWPSELKTVVVLIACCIALMWVPIRKQDSTQMPAVVRQEFEMVQEEVAALDALVEESDPQIEAWKDTLADIEDGMSVGNTLRTLDDLSQQIEQRKDEAMDAVTEAMDALEQGDSQELSKSIESLRKQNMLPPSVQEAQSAAEGAGNNSEKTDGQDTPTGGQQGEESQKGMSQQQQQLSQQLQQLQSQLQQMQSSSNQANGTKSDGLTSFSNQDLQQLSEMNQGKLQGGQSSNGNQENGSQQLSGSASDSSDGPAGQSGISQGGGASPLTYGPETDLIPNSNLRTLDGIPQVDWASSVQFGTAPGQAGEVKTVPVSTDGTVQSVAPMTGQQQVAPQHRTAVKEFFAVEQTDTND